MSNSSAMYVEQLSMGVVLAHAPQRTFGAYEKSAPEA